MPRVTSVTDVDCFCVCAEMPPISSASSRDTRWISVSACPAASESFVPSTTPTVDFSMAATASCVSA